MVVPNDQHPYGTTLLSRDTPENRQRWGPNGVGNINVLPSVCKSNQCPFYHYKKDATRLGGAFETPIHLLIASYRDRLCPRTLFNAFHRAENPQRIFVRIIEQTQPGSTLIDDAGCWDRYCKDYNTDCEEYRNNVRTVPVDATKSKGPTDARSKLSAMIYWDYVHQDDSALLDFQRVELQDFCMQTDSHMDFSDNYDTELIFMHHRTENDYAVLSTYVANMDQNNKDLRDALPNLCMVEFTSTIRNWGTKECANLVKPKLTNAMWGAGLSFHRCHAEINVPVDPYLDDVFDGEEGSRGLRFFTHGYDVYTPDRVLVTHDYDGHQNNPVVHTWGNHVGAHEMEDTREWMKDIDTEREKIQTIGTGRVNMMLGIGTKEYSLEEKKEIERIRGSRFGIGTKRSLEQAGTFSGIDLAARKMVENKCGNLIWVPFVASAGDYGVSEMLQRGLAGPVNQNENGKSLGDRHVHSAGSGQGVRAALAHVVERRHEKVESRVLSVALIVTVVATTMILVVMAKSTRRRKRARHKI